MYLGRIVEEMPMLKVPSGDHFAACHLA